MHLFFPGDSLWTPLERRRGLPLGNLSSQWLGNVVLDRLDHTIKDEWGVKGYVRYLDDLALFADSRAACEALRTRIQQALDRLRLQLHPRKTHVQPCQQAALFLGLELDAGGHRRLPAANVARAAERLQQLRGRWQEGSITEADARQALNGWQAHARHADTWQLRQRWLGHGLFNPGEEPLRTQARA